MGQKHWPNTGQCISEMATERCYAAEQLAIVRLARISGQVSESREMLWSDVLNSTLVKLVF